MLDYSHIGGSARRQGRALRIGHRQRADPIKIASKLNITLYELSTHKYSQLCCDWYILQNSYNSMCSETSDPTARLQIKNITSLIRPVPLWRAI